MKSLSNYFSSFSADISTDLHDGHDKQVRRLFISNILGQIHMLKHFKDYYKNGCFLSKNVLDRNSFYGKQILKIQPIHNDTK